eukprot:8322890-Lingulodinium_polyedra.AAC.1
MVFAWCVRRAPNASCCGGAQRPQPHHCAAFQTPHNGAVAVVVCRRSGSLFARVARAVRAPFSGVRVARVT